MPVKEIGSFFEYPDSKCFGVSSVEHDFLGKQFLLSSGRDIFCYLGGLFGGRKIYLPDYFCPHTRNFISRYFDVVVYDDIPNMPLKCDKVDDGSLFLVVNLFGTYDPSRYEFLKSYKNIIRIEDHTHAPFCKYAMNCVSGYIMASLRKTLPVLAAYVSMRPIVECSDSGESLDDRFFYAGKEKQNSLKSGDVSVKNNALRSFSEVEYEIDINNVPRKIGSKSMRMLFNLDVAKLQKKRFENFSLFKNLIGLPLANGGIADAYSAFNPVLLLSDKMERDALKRHLIKNFIYPPIHWVIDDYNYGDTKDFSDRVLTIPVDYRYDKNDVARVCECINLFMRV